MRRVAFALASILATLISSGRVLADGVTVNGVELFDWTTVPSGSEHTLEIKGADAAIFGNALDLTELSIDFNGSPVPRTLYIISRSTTLAGTHVDLDGRKAWDGPSPVVAAAPGRLMLLTERVLIGSLPGLSVDAAPASDGDWITNENAVQIAFNGLSLPPAYLSAVEQSAADLVRRDSKGECLASAPDVDYLNVPFDSKNPHKARTDGDLACDAVMQSWRTAYDWELANNPAPLLKRMVHASTIGAAHHVTTLQRYRASQSSVVVRRIGDGDDGGVPPIIRSAWVATLANSLMSRAQRAHGSGDRGELASILQEVAGLYQSWVMDPHAAAFEESMRKLTEVAVETGMTERVPPATAQAYKTRGSVLRVSPKLGAGYAVPIEREEPGGKVVVITASHVIADALDSAEVIELLMSSGKPLQASCYRGRMESCLPADGTDLAVLEVADLSDLALPAQAEIKSGEKVSLVGRFASDWQVALRLGEAMAEDGAKRNCELEVRGLATQRGTSGGPYVSASGVVGIHVSSTTPTTSCGISMKRILSRVEELRR